jgi:hypothetical protein
MSAREVLGRTLRDPLLIEMLLCPLMWYGNPRERDMDFGQFCIMFRSIFLEGFARPPRRAADPAEPGETLPFARGRTAIAQRRATGSVEDGRATGVVLDDGQQIPARRVLSSAGLVETMRLCEDITRVETAGRTVVVHRSRSRSSTNSPAELGHDRTIVFYNDGQVPLADAARGTVRHADRRHLLAQQLRLRRGRAVPDGVIRITA